MAIIKEENSRRVDVHDGWIEIRAQVTVGDIRRLTADRGLEELQNPQSDFLFTLLSRFIVAWSYDESVTQESIEALDWEAATTVMGVIGELMGTNPKKEVNGSMPSLAESGTPT